MKIHHLALIIAISSPALTLASEVGSYSCTPDLTQETSVQFVSLKPSGVFISGSQFYQAFSMSLLKNGTVNQELGNIGALGAYTKTGKSVNISLNSDGVKLAAISLCSQLGFQGCASSDYQFKTLPNPNSYAATGTVVGRKIVGSYNLNYSFTSSQTSSANVAATIGFICKKN